MKSKSLQMASYLSSPIYFWFDKDWDTESELHLVENAWLGALHFLMLHSWSQATLSLSTAEALFNAFSFQTNALNKCCCCSCCQQHVAALIVVASRRVASFAFFFGIFVAWLGLNCYQTLNDLQLSIELLPDKSCLRLPLDSAAATANACGILNKTKSKKVKQQKKN